MKKLMIACFVLVFASRAEAESAELLAYWPMNEVVVNEDGARVAKDAIGSRDLFLGDGVTVANTEFGSSLKWDGTTTAYGVYTNDVEFQEYTFTAWLNASSDSDAYEAGVPGNKYPRVFAIREDYLHLTPSAGVNATYQRKGCSRSKALTPVMPAKDVWYHLAVVAHREYNADEQNWKDWTQVYVNGKLSATNAVEFLDATGNGIKVNSLIAIGNQGGGNGAIRPLIGMMSDVRIYSGALTEGEVANVMMGAPDVDAGIDFSVDGETAKLYGNVVRPSQNSFKLGGSADFVWEVLLKPEGAAEVVIDSPKTLMTDVALPMNGEYVFRLSATNNGETKSDVVTVTRHEAGADEPPTVSISGEATIAQPAPLSLTATVADGDSQNVRVAWGKASGPGGVYFTEPNAVKTSAIFTMPGEYVLECMADDGANVVSATKTVTVGGTGASIMPSDKLALYWNFDGEGATKNVGDLISNKAMVSKNGAIFTEPSIVGYGLRARDYRSYADSGCKMPDADELTVSFWMYYDMADTNNTTYTRILTRGKVEFQLDAQNVPQNAAKSLVVRISDNAGNTTSWSFGSLNQVPGGMTNRWVHMAVAMNLTPDAVGEVSDMKSRIALYVDGVKRPNGSVNAKKDGVSLLDADGKMNFTGKANETTNMRWGGSGDVSANAPISRIFPGILDEIRIYTNVLTSAEIARLAIEPAEVNRAPIIELPEVRNIRGTATKPISVGAAVYDDGLPSGELSVEWEVLSGDESAIEFPAAPSGNITVVREGRYVIRLKAGDGAGATFSAPITLDVAASGTVLIIR